MVFVLIYGQWIEIFLTVNAWMVAWEETEESTLKDSEMHVKRALSNSVGFTVRTWDLQIEEILSVIFIFHFLIIIRKKEP